ncbi:MAG: transcription antitermination factor NusB [Bacteroidota bacterium]
MQTLYAWQRVRASDFQLSEDRIKESFDPVLVAKDTIPDKGLLKQQEKEAILLFKKSYETPDFSFAEEVEDIVKQAVVDARNYHKELRQKDLKFLRQQMLVGADQVHNRYIQLLQLLVELGLQNERDYEDRKQRANQKEEVTTLPKLTFKNNPLLNHLEAHEELQQLVAKYNVGWENERDEVRRWFRELAGLEFFQTYQKLENPTVEEHRQVLMDILKQLIFKSEALVQFMEDLDLNWEENAEVLRSMLRKTVKAIPTDAETSFELIDLSPNWEEDRLFFEDLFDHTLKEDEYTDEVVAEHAKNWEFDRIAATDKIILKMAVTEMIHFPSVPVKVTINEYIEISKQYSTPKSKQFVNGMLDVIAEHLKNSGTIRKSGRGLIDNK